MSASQLEPSLDWLIDPVKKDLFFDQYWEKQPLVIARKCKDYFASLLSLNEVDRVITTLNLSYPSITLKNADKNVLPADYSVRGALDVAAVYQLFQEGSTIVLAFLDNVTPPLTSLCRRLENEFCFPLQANAYLTPAGAKGARHHYDTHDVFVLQVVGSKRWSIYGTPLELPLRAQEFDAAIHERGAPTMEFELTAGDAAYIPRGAVHDARSSDDVSLHITLGVLSYTWADLLLEFVADTSLNDPAFRKALPPGFGREDFDPKKAEKIFQELLQRVSSKSNLDRVLERFADQWISASPPLLSGQMKQMALIRQLKIDSVVRARKEVVALIRMDGDSASVHFYGRKISFPVYALDAVTFVLQESRCVVRDLPGDLDEEGKLTLVRRLIREGLVLVQES